ncbi:MAG: sugar ABC transporter ATP-binding protein [Armatimonadetes bacterium]|nr:ATP-binding cassette domain-containing protein [Armatimonadota bacterium]MBS1701952.1 sugar ABC transporter ATP-binding protein [Armatimonadota bacterium]MBS1728210.1 sugar ABC transporter ATP-binding protein [Armatimonadota bacterium]
MLLQLKGITKRFPGVVALENVNLDLAAGEVVAIIGENGAGKSTLMKILSGVYQADGGSIQFEGKPLTLRSPSDALDKGIRIIYQELSGLDNLDVASNIFLGREYTKGPFVDQKKLVDLSRSILERVGLKVLPSTLLSRLSIAEKQLVEIARALSLKVKVLILDEPTSSLTLEETHNLLALVKSLKAEGVSILYITHRLDEVQQIADRVVGLRDGKNAGGLAREEITKAAMVKMMVGRDIERANFEAKEGGEVVMRLVDFRTTRYPDKAINLDIRAGEILGMAGLVGAGRSELVRAIFGIDPFQGRIEIGGKAVRIRSPKDAIQYGVFLAPEDRRGCGLTVQMSVKDNVTMPKLAWLSTAGLVRRRDEEAYARDSVGKMSVKTASIHTEISTLSGGNQQKVVLGRWMAMNPKVLIVDEPTRGIDVGSKAEIYEELRMIASTGTAIWMISSDMEEVINVSDRVAVMHEGQLGGILDRTNVTEEAIMKLATGGH